MNAGRGDTLEINFTPQIDGYLAMCGAVVKIANGHASLKLSLLDEGVIYPAAFTDKKILLEPLFYEGGRIQVMPITVEAEHRLLERVDKLEGTCRALQDKIRVLEEKIGTPLIL